MYRPRNIQRQCDALNVTGSIVVGVVFDGGVIVGTDSRCTKNKMIINDKMGTAFKLSNHSIACGFGSGADLHRVAIEAKYQLDSVKNTDEEFEIEYIATVLSNILYKYDALLSTYILGGIDEKGPQLYSIQNDGKIETSSFSCAGHGKNVAMAILENKWRKNLSKTDAITLVCDALSSAIKNNLKCGAIANMWGLERKLGGVIIRKEFTQVIEEKKTANNYRLSFQSIEVESEHVYRI